MFSNIYVPTSVQLVDESVTLSDVKYRYGCATHMKPRDYSKTAFCTDLWEVSHR